MPRAFSYGGQAVLAGVMIRGQRCISLAVRRPDGVIAVETRPLPRFVLGPLRRVPLLRGVLVLAETLVIGVQALGRSAELALEEPERGSSPLSPWAMALTMTLALGLGVGLFFVLPLLAARALDPLVASDLGSNAIEGLIRLAVLVGYIWAIGRIPEIRKVFAYHGAEHMAVHAYESGMPLEPAVLRRFPTAHPRCGTAFLLTLAVVAVLVFALLGRPPLIWSAVLRVILIPAIAAVSYELVRFTGAHGQNGLVRAVALPGLALQALTTRQPEEEQVEVAIAAMRRALEEDGAALASPRQLPGPTGAGPAAPATPGTA